MLSRSPPVLPPAQRSHGGPATLGLASYFLGSGSIRGATQQRGDPWGKHRRASGGDGLPPVGPGEKGKWFAGSWEGWRRPDPSPSPSCRASFPVCRMGWLTEAAAPGVLRASPPPTVSPALRTASSPCHHLGKRDGEGRTDRHRKQEGGCCPPHSPHPRLCLQGDREGRLP